MSQPHTGQPFPRGALIGAAALIAVAMLAAGGSRLGAAAPEAPTAVVSRDLRFADAADGGVLVYEEPGGAVVARLAPGTNGFARALLRGLARERKREGFGAEPPFRLMLAADGALVLEDTANGRLIDLGAFGATNAQAFAQLLDTGGSLR